MSEPNRGKEDRAGGAPTSPLKSTTPTPVGTPSRSQSAPHTLSGEQFDGADAAAAHALGVVPAEPAHEDSNPAAPMAEESLAADGADQEDLELDLASGDEGATVRPRQCSLSHFCREQNTVG